MAVIALSKSLWRAMRFLDVPVLIRWLVLSHAAVGIEINPVLNRRLLMNAMRWTNVSVESGRANVRLNFMWVVMWVVLDRFNNLQTYTIFLLFATVNTSSTALAGVCGTFGHEKTHTVGDVGLVVL